MYIINSIKLLIQIEEVSFDFQNLILVWTWRYIVKVISNAHNETKCHEECGA